MSNISRYNLVYKLLKANGYAVNRRELKLELFSHPEFPSLKAITDTLDRIDIENIVVNIPKDSISKLPNTFMASLKNNEISLVKKNTNGLKLYTEKFKTQKKSFLEFNNEWTGSILAIEKSKNKTTIKHKLFYFLKAFIFLISIIAIFKYNMSAMFILSFIGLAISIMVLRKELGIFDIFSQKICSLNEKINCNLVIDSQKTVFFNTLSLGDLSLIFFMSSVVINLFLGFNYLFYSIFLILSLPIILYTIYLQAVIIKKWCSLCLLISLTTLIMISFLSLYNYNWSFDIQYWKKSILISFSILIAWLYLKSHLKKYIHLIKEQYSYLKLKRDFKLFDSVLSSDKKFISNSLNKISFGASNPKIVIDAITNPLCSFCKDSFNSYKVLLDNEKYKSDLQINFIFNPINDGISLSKEISAKVLNIYSNFGKKACFEAMDMWFNSDSNKWQKKYSSVSGMRNIDLETHLNWCETNKISYSPLTLLNGHEYPITHYQIKDINYFIEELLAKRNQ